MKIVNITRVGSAVSSVCVDGNATIRQAAAASGISIASDETVVRSGTTSSVSPDSNAADCATYIISKNWKGNQDLVTIMRLGGEAETVCVAHGSTVSDALALVKDESSRQIIASETGSFAFHGQQPQGIQKEAKTTTIPSGQGTVRIMLGKNWKGNLRISW